MIPRYSMPEIAELWTDEYKYRTWLEVELAACEAWSRLGKIPKAAVARLQKKARFNSGSILKIEAKVKHDVIAFLTEVGRHVGPDAKYLHYGLTSSDMLDTATAIILKRSGLLIRERLKALMGEIRRKAMKYKYQPKVGRTHGIHAEPTSLGLTFALWYAECERHLERLDRAIEIISVGMFSGPVGTYTNVDPRVEQFACKLLGLKPVKISTQVIQRDRHAEFMSVLALIASSIDKFATEIRHLQKTEVLELEEGFSKGQKGSSSMPHKKNPITCEQMSGMARLMRSNLSATLENIPLWHERDISHSSIERIIFPDSTMLAYYMLAKFAEVVKNLTVYPKNLKKNLELTGGLVFTGGVLLAVTDKLGSREKAYALVQKIAHDAWSSGRIFREELAKNPTIREHFSDTELEKMFDVKDYLGHVDYIFKRVFG